MRLSSRMDLFSIRTNATNVESIMMLRLITALIAERRCGEEKRMSKIKVIVPFTVPIEIDTEEFQLDDDLVAVVRCKDCRHWWMPCGTDNTRGVCQLLDVNTDDDFFCKIGER